MEPHLVILAGGVSSRMKKPGAAPLDARLQQDAERKPKAMIGVGEKGRPFMDYLLRNADRAGYRDVVIVVGGNDESVRAHYGDLRRGNAAGNLRISYAVQPVPEGRVKPPGTADAVQRALEERTDWSGTRFTVCNSDNLYSVRALRLLRESADPGAMIGYDREALGFRPERVLQFAVIETDGEGFLKSIREKPEPGEVRRAAGPGGHVWVSMNIWRFSYDTVLPYLTETPLHPVRQEKELPATVAMLVADNPRAVRVYPLAEQVPDLTDRNDIERVQQYLRDSQTEGWE